MDDCEHLVVDYEEKPYTNPHVNDWVATFHRFTCLICKVQAQVITRVHLEHP